ncbi:hypothetical protein NC651_034207 [Populus alba x Populus x berolinensis]|nr:hypothetical protein NC651_034207 [Populus alba x Populus x berolinensis]
MLKVPDHQVAGHQARNGQLGPLIDDSGRFYKPLQDDDRGSKEVAFYSSFSSNTRVPDHIRRLFPVFHGTQLLEASDGSGLRPHLVLEDVVSTRSHPSVMDIKIGSRTWYPEASEDYIQRCFKKDRETSSLSLGFRISGLQIYGNEESGFWKPERKLVQNLSAADVRVVLKKFVSSDLPVDPNSDPDCSFAASVYGGSTGILAQLLELKAWFEDQTMYHLNSCSVLLVYEKEKLLKGERSDAEVKLIDFAHVTEGKGIIDHNFLGGLCSLIKFISEILTSPDECTTKACLRDSEKDKEILTSPDECTTKACLRDSEKDKEILTSPDECTTKVCLQDSDKNTNHSENGDGKDSLLGKKGVCIQGDDPWRLVVWLNVTFRRAACFPVMARKVAIQENQINRILVQRLLQASKLSSSMASLARTQTASFASDFKSSKLSRPVLATPRKFLRRIVSFTPPIALSHRQNRLVLSVKTPHFSSLTSPRGNFNLRDFHLAVNNVPTDSFLPEINDSGSLRSFDVKLSSILSDQVLYSWGGKDIMRKVIVLSSCVPDNIDTELKLTLMDAADKCVSVEFVLFEQSSSHLGNFQENINSFMRSISDLDNFSFGTYLADSRVFHSLVKRWLQELKDDMEEPLQARFIFKSNLTGSLNQIFCSLSTSVCQIIDGFQCLRGRDLEISDVIENSVQVGDKTVLFMPSFQSSMKLKQVSSPIDFNIIERANLSSLSEGLIIGSSYFVTPSACYEIETSDEMDRPELNASKFFRSVIVLDAIDLEDETPLLDLTNRGDKTTASIAEEWEQLVVKEVPKTFSPACVSKPKMDQSVLSSPDSNRKLDAKTSRILERLGVAETV